MHHEHMESKLTNPVVKYFIERWKNRRPDWKRDLKRRELELVVAALNGQQRALTSDDCRALVDFVEQWNRSGRNLEKAPLSDILSDKDARFSLAHLSSVWFSTLLPDAPRRRGPFAAGGLNWVHMPLGLFQVFNIAQLPAFIDRAALFAGLLLMNPLRGHLSDAPCQRAKCGKWFIKKKSGQKNCSRRCLVIVRSMIVTKKEREDQHKERLKLARQALRSYRKKDGDWKEFVSKKTEEFASKNPRLAKKTGLKKETGLTKKYLTRAMNKGQLKPPRGAK